MPATFINIQIRGSFYRQRLKFRFQKIKKWSETRIFSTNSIDLSNKKRILPVEIQLNEKGKKLPARYIRFKATNIGVVPNGHEAAGQPAWLFIDEIEVK